MWRLFLLLIVLAIAVSMAAWLLTGKIVYKRLAVRLGKFGLLSILLIFGLLILERLVG